MHALLATTQYAFENKSRVPLKVLKESLHLVFQLLALASSDLPRGLYVLQSTCVKRNFSARPMCWPVVATQPNMPKNSKHSGFSKKKSV